MFDYLNQNATKATLGFGGMRLPDDAETTKMVDAFLDAGYNYFDTAYIYEGSEEKFKRTLTTRHNRDKFVVADKLPPWEVKNHTDCERILKEQLKRIGLDYFDYYLVHSLDDSREKSVDEQGLFEWCYEQKRKGFVKHVGFSFHGTTPYLERLLQKYPDAEFVQLQLNYIDVLRGPAKQWQDLANKYNKPIIVMEPVKGGSLAKLPEAAEKLFKDYNPNRSIASWAMQYVGNLKGATCILGGMSNLEHMHDNIKTYEDLKPLTDEEMKLIEAVLNEMAKISQVPCTACKYCHANCPVNIDIASCFSLHNDLKRAGDNNWNVKMMYSTLGNGHRAGDCIDCEACLSHCPQHINIPDELKTVAKAFK